MAAVLGGPTDVARYDRPHDLAVIEREPTEELPSRVYLSVLPNGPLVVLEGSGAAIWQEAQVDAPSSIVDRLSAAAGLPADDIRDDVESFLEELVRAGLLRRTVPS